MSFQQEFGFGHSNLGNMLGIIIILILLSCPRSCPFQTHQEIPTGPPPRPTYQRTVSARWKYTAKARISQPSKTFQIVLEQPAISSSHAHPPMCHGVAKIIGHPAAATSSSEMSNVRYRRIRQNEEFHVKPNSQEGRQ